ncbi:hypothetical protein H5410_033898 [Solanum commersonii]|uniref:SWIM-type domain-containing protein n=1 Tax=Solanum commersonii TaxID=4109 RepID=A0A9J5YS39_SOLCO|nr:hypothetical protein H5410_033898 [Solanum commersonii]
MDSFISSRNNVMKFVKECPRTHKPLMPKKGTTTRLSSGSCFLETSKALELHFSNYLEVVSDIGIEDTIVDNREDNGVDKNVLIEGNSTKVVLQGIRGDVTNEVDEEFSDADYNLSDEDDDFWDVIDDQQVKKLRGRPKNARVNVPVSSGILVPLQNADVESDYAYSDELPDDDVQFDKGENNGQKNNIYEKYDEGKNKNLPRLALGMKFKNFKQFKEACRELGIRKRRQLRFKPNDQQRVAWRDNNQALKWIYGDDGLQYGKLLSYRAELLRSNPGSNVVIWRDGGKFLGFYKCMEALDQEDKATREWFNNPKRSFQSWTRALFRTNTKCDMLLNNLCESFNRYILDARDKAIITMLEMIKKQVGEKNVQVKRVGCKISKEAIWFKTDYSGGPRVSVDDPGGVNIVDMKAKSCTCRRWELSGLPCRHAYACIIGNSERVEDYKKRERKPKSRKKEPEELEKKKKVEGVGKAEKRVEQKSEKRRPQKLSKKGST